MRGTARGAAGTGAGADVGAGTGIGAWSGAGVGRGRRSLLRALPGRRALLAGVAAGLALALAGCGFHLEGHTPLPARFKVSYVDAKDQQSDFVQGLRKALLINGAQLTGDATKATAVVHVATDHVEQRVLSVSPENLPREYELTYTVRFSVNAGDTDLLTEQEVSVKREFSFNVNQLLAKDNEQDILQQALARDLVDVVMRRLSRL